MKRTMLLAGVATVLFAANVQAAESNGYVGVKLRSVDMSTEVSDNTDSLDVEDKVFGGSFAIGTSTKLDAGTLRGELEYNINADSEESFGPVDFAVKSQAIMFNAYFDINTGTRFTPYVGAGLGAAVLEGEATMYGYSDSIDSVTFAWQVGAGAALAVSDNVSIDVGYRYFDYGDFEDKGLTVDTSAHELYVGARYAF